MKPALHLVACPHCGGTDHAASEHAAWTPPYEPDPLADVPALADPKPRLNPRTARREKKRARDIAAGKCVICGLPRSEKNRRLCEPHRLASIEYLRAYRRETA